MKIIGGHEHIINWLVANTNYLLGGESAKYFARITNEVGINKYISE